MAMFVASSALYDSTPYFFIYANRNKAESREVTKQVVWVILTGYFTGLSGTFAVVSLHMSEHYAH